MSENEVYEVKDPNAEKSAGQADQKGGRWLSDRAKAVGRDGAYLEVQADGLVAAAKSGDLAAAKMVVVTASRVDISDPSHLASLKVVMAAAEAPENAQDFEGMTDEQRSVAVFRSVFEAGLAALASSLGGEKTS